MADGQQHIDMENVVEQQPVDKASGIDENLEIALREGEGHEDDREHDFGGDNAQMEFGEKKRKNRKKKKPKTKRGLVRFQYIVNEN